MIKDFKKPKLTEMSYEDIVGTTASHHLKAIRVQEMIKEIVQEVKTGTLIGIREQIIHPTSILN